MNQELSLVTLVSLPFVQRFYWNLDSTPWSECSHSFTPSSVVQNGRVDIIWANPDVFNSGRLTEVEQNSNFSQNKITNHGRVYNINHTAS